MASASGIWCRQRQAEGAWLAWVDSTGVAPGVGFVGSSGLDVPDTSEAAGHLGGDPGGGRLTRLSFAPDRRQCYFLGFCLLVKRDPY